MASGENESWPWESGGGSQLTPGLRGPVSGEVHSNVGPRSPQRENWLPCCVAFRQHTATCQLFRVGLSHQEPPPLRLTLATGRGRGIKTWTSRPAAGHPGGQYSLQNQAGPAAAESASLSSIFLCPSKSVSASASGKPYLRQDTTWDGSP